MKTLFTFVLINLLLLSCITSCGKNSSNTSQHGMENADQKTPDTSAQSPISSYDKFVYRTENDKLDWTKVGMPLKVNMVSGKTTTACTDPLCMHDTEDCPFYECTGGMIDGEILFYRRGWQLRDENGYTGTEKLCTYHVATGEMHILEKYTDSLVFLGVYDDVLYYYTAEWTKEGTDLICTYRLHRANGKSGKIKELSMPETYKTVGGYTDNRDYPNILMIDGDTIYWYKYAEDMTAAFYTSDLDADNWMKIEDGVQTFANIYHQGYAYSIGADMEMIDPDIGFAKDNFTYSYYLSRRKLGAETDATERIAENIGSSNFIVTDRYVFYMEGLEPVPDDLVVKSGPYSSGSIFSIGSSTSNMEIMNGCRVWRMNHDGSNKMQIAETADYFFGGKQHVHDEVLFGYYEDDDNAYLAFFFMEKDENGELVMSEDTLILDTAAGIFTVSEYVE